MARVFKPPAPLPPLEARSVFLAGSIEMDRAEDWQRRVEQALADVDVVVLNPRREAWDASWSQEASDPQFRAQVEWELEALDRAGLIALYLLPGTRSPISLLELGLHARSGRLIVCCPDGFWRKGNVDIVCERHGVPQVPDLDGLIAAVTAFARGEVP